MQPVYDSVQDRPTNNVVFTVTANQAYGCCSDQHSQSATDHVDDTYEDMSHPTDTHIVVQDNNVYYT